MEPIGNFIFPPQPGRSNMCGAYALAYWWSRQQSPPKTDREIEAQAKEYYNAVQFKKTDFIADPGYDAARLQSCTSARSSVCNYIGHVIPYCASREGNGYCNPQAMMTQIMLTHGCEFYLGCDPLIWAIYVKLQSIDPAIKDYIHPTAYAESEQGDMLEVVSVKGGVGLHYLYVFSEDGVRKAIDPAEGLEQGKEAMKRDIVMRKYNKTQAAIVIGQR